MWANCPYTRPMLSAILPLERPNETTALNILKAGTTNAECGQPSRRWRGHQAEPSESKAARAKAPSNAERERVRELSAVPCVVVVGTVVQHSAKHVLWLISRLALFRTSNFPVCLLPLSPSHTLSLSLWYCRRTLYMQILLRQHCSIFVDIFMLLFFSLNLQLKHLISYTSISISNVLNDWKALSNPLHGVLKKGIDSYLGKELSCQFQLVENIGTIKCLGCLPISARFSH